MEQRLVPIVEGYGFKATPNPRFRDLDTGETRELDVFAIGGEPIGKCTGWLIFPVLLIACKNLSCPLVFFTQAEIRMKFLLGELQVSGLPREIVRPGRKPEPITEFLKPEEFHHYYRTGRVASQFCAVYEKGKSGGQQTWEAGHKIDGRIDVFRDFESLAHAVRSEQHDYGQSFHLDRKGEPLNLQFYYPIFVTGGSIIECFVSSGRPRYRRVHRIGYLLRSHLGTRQREMRVDVVDEQGIRRLLLAIEKETQEIARRIGRHRATVAESLAWITRRLARRAPAFRASYVSGEEV